MANTSLNEVRVGILDTLKADGTLVALVTGVYGNVPQQTAYPYVVLGDMTEVPFNMFGKDGKESTITLHAWSQYVGFKEALSIIDRVNEVLDNAAIIVDGFTLVLCQHETTNTLIDPDGITHHVTAGYRVTVQE